MRLFIAASLLAALSFNADAATFHVTRADDPLTPQCEVGNCSLRGAMAAAQITPEADLILVPAGSYLLARAPVRVFGGVTIRGAGSATTSIVSTSDSVALVGFTLSDLVIEGVTFAAPEGDAIKVTDGKLTLRDVVLPSADNTASVQEDALSASLLVENSRLPLAGCIGNTAACTLRDSAIGTIGLLGAQATLDAQGITSVGTGSSTGLYLFSNGRVHVVDSTFSNHAKPIDVNASDADILIERTRFLGNTGPMRGAGGGMATLHDVEFSDNIVSNANITLPAVLHATDGTAWRINRALFDGNRGGGDGNTVGAVIAADPGANLYLINVTFTDNTYRSGIAAMTAHGIGVVSTANNPAVIRLIHATLRRATSVPAATLGSVLAVSGQGASVFLLNSVLDGTCRFGNGGSVANAVGTIESIGSTCGIAGAGNYVNVPSATLGLGTLADNGGFTWSVLPRSGSYVIDRANATWCPLVFGMDQRRYQRPADVTDCDIGAVEREGTPVTTELFAVGFE